MSYLKNVMKSAFSHGNRAKATAGCLFFVAVLFCLPPLQTIALKVAEKFLLRRALANPARWKILLCEIGVLFAAMSFCFAFVPKRIWAKPVPKISKENISLLRLVFLATFIFGIVAHGYCYFNMFFSHDSLGSLYSETKIVGIYFQNMRFLNTPVRKFLCPISSPSLVGFLSLFFIGIATFLVIKLMNFRSTLSICAVCGLMTTNAAVTLTNATYIHDIAAYMLAMLFAVTGAFFTRKSKKLILPAMCFVCSLALYQSHFQVAIIALMILAAKDILDGKPANEVLLFARKSILLLFCSLVLYYVVAKMLLFLFGLKPTDYVGFDKTLQFESPKEILNSVFIPYKKFLKFLISPYVSDAHINFMRVANLIFVAVTGVLIAKRLAKIRTDKAANSLLFVLWMLVFPFGVDFCGFIGKGEDNMLGSYSFYFSYIFALMTAEIHFCNIDSVKISMFIKKKAILFCTFLLIFFNIVFSNQTYLYKKLVYQNTFLTMNRVIDRIEQTEGYAPGNTPVAFCGDSNKILTERNSLSSNFKNGRFIGLGSAFALTYSGTYDRFFSDIISYKIRLAEYSEWEKMAETESVKAMPCFPQNGSVKNIDGIVVVKWSD